MAEEKQDKKFGDLVEAGALTGDELVAMVQQISEQSTSVKVTLAILKKFFGDVTVVDVGVNLNTLTEPGLYILQGAETMQESYNLNYPSGFNPGGKVVMLVSCETDNWAMIVQTYFYAKLTSNPCPYSRGKSGGSAWGSWTQPVSGTQFDSSALKQLNMSQMGLQLQEAGSNKTSSVYAYKQPVEDGSGPSLKTAPSNRPGMHISFVDPNSKSIIGTYKGNVLAMDADGRVFTNVDNTQVTNADNPNGVNWRELITVEQKSMKAISKPTMENSFSTIDAVGKIIQVLRDNHMLKDMDEPVSKILITEPTGSTVSVEAGQTVAVELHSLPFYGTGKIYARSSHPEFMTVAGVIENSGTITVDENGAMVMYGASAFELEPPEEVQLGTAVIEFSGDAAFATILASLEVTVTAPPAP